MWGTTHLTGGSHSTQSRPPVTFLHMTALRAPLDLGEDTTFSVTYDGPALAAGRMDVRVLASAMASVAQLVDDAARLLHGPRTGIRVEVSGNFRRGSFSYQVFAAAIADLTAEQVKEILVWLGLIASTSGSNVIEVVRWLRGRKVRKVTQEGQTATITAGNESTVVNLQVAQLVMNYNIRADLEGATQPLAESGIDVMRTGEYIETPSVEITAEDRGVFLAPPQEATTLHEGDAIAVLQLVSPVFKPGNKWQFAFPGEASFHAPIQDKSFLERARKREVEFRYGDLIRVHLRTTVSRTESGGLTTAREILEVIEILPPPEQFTIFPAPKE